MLYGDIRFPNLGIILKSVGNGIEIFGFRITYYGIIIMLGILAGYYIVQYEAKRTNQSSELYLDFAIYVIITSVIGSRIYYIIFNWNKYKDDIIQIFNLRSGGLAIYGGIIAAFITAYIYAKLKKISFGLLCDTSVLGLILGQAIGRWGNFFNREAFGEYTNNIFAMQLNINEVNMSNITTKMLENIKLINDIKYIQVHPTFLYESIWNFILFIFLFNYTKRKKFDGEILLLYLIGYGLARIFIESLRTDKLFIWGTSLAVSQILSIIIVIISSFCIIIKRINLKSIDN